jgi:cytidylate kinase
LTQASWRFSVDTVSCQVICISHATGAGGEEIGRQLAERLGFLYVDEAIIARAATEGGLAPADVASEERRKSLALRILDALAEGGAETFSVSASGWSPGRDELRSDDVRALIRETIEQTAGRGKVVIVAHAASHALSAGPRVLRVLVTASPATRARRVSEADGVDHREASRTVKESDGGRRDYLKRFYDVEEELPIHYDLVINTDVLSYDQAAELLTYVTSR